MKFKALFILFNVVIVVSFLFIFLMPVFVLGGDFVRVFWQDNWYISILFVVVLVLLNWYFVRNWKLFTLLEEQDWPGLIGYLESRIYEDARADLSHLRILVNAYVVTANMEKIGALEAHIRGYYPHLLPKLAIVLGVPHLLRNDADDMIAYFGDLKDEKRCPERDWIRWDYAFALISRGRALDAKPFLVSIADESRDPLLLLLTAYLLEAYHDREDEARAKRAEVRSKLTKRYRRDDWVRLRERGQRNLQVVVLSRLIEEAVERLYSPDADVAEPSARKAASSSQTTQSNDTPPDATTTANDTPSDDGKRNAEDEG